MQTGSNGKRGLHWRDKVAAGQMPNIAKFTAKWAVCASKTESQLQELLSRMGIVYVPPWNRPNAQSAYMGNTANVLFMRLIMHHLNGVVQVNFIPNTGVIGERWIHSMGTGFMGIERFTILQPEVFDATTGDPDCDIHTIQWARANLNISKIKTVRTYWSRVSLVEDFNADGKMMYVFDQQKREKRKQFVRQYQGARMAKRQRVVSPEKGSIAFILCGDP
jgi:hypothetical protein